MNYAAYLKTDHWRSIRTGALERARNRCQLCGSIGKIEVHHNSYRNLWNEQPHEVVAICRNCHQIYHDRMKPPFDIDELLDEREPEPEPVKIPRQVTEAEFQTIKELWIRENQVVLDAQAGKISEDKRIELITEIRTEIDFIKYEA